MTAQRKSTISLDEQRVDQLSSMLKAMGQPLRIQLITIIIQERLASIPTLQEHLPDVDPFLMYSNLRYMHKKQLIKKLRKGREIFYGLSEKALVARVDALFEPLPDYRRSQLGSLSA